AAGMGLADKRLGVVIRAESGIDRVVVGDVVAVEVARRAGAFEEGGEPKARDAKVFQRVKALNDALEIAKAVLVRIAKRRNPEMINDGILVPVLNLGLET